MIVYTLGFVFVKSGYLAVSVSLAETLRSAEPLFSVFFAKLFLPGEIISFTTILTLLPIVLGGALSSGGDATFTLTGFIFVCFSNIMFALRSIFTKQLRGTGYTGNAMQTFYEISLYGFVLLLGLTLCLEFTLLFLVSDENLLMYSITQVNFSTMKWSDEFWRLLVINGFSYAAYNQMSFLVLSMVTVVTHAVGNSFRRVVTILVSVWMLGNMITTQNACGIALAISGVVAYSFSKAKDEAEVNKHRVV
jgi:solute carrier family 35 protein E1